MNTCLTVNVQILFNYNHDATGRDFTVLRIIETSHAYVYICVCIYIMYVYK